ncbi:hypothetical protein KP509_33G010100 [Ceratopteris richardii]|uniref:Uncharacterized protein n=1 Tax=Ceratopteris richardii TaxID=49495 RepID=A0A8T2QLL8_CERRI|nr:hypothetical protein KP509_33G010100 [Ceratopteris richardii]
MRSSASRLISTLLRKQAHSSHIGAIRESSRGFPVHYEHRYTTYSRLQPSSLIKYNQITGWFDHNAAMQRLYCTQRPATEDEDAPIESELRRKIGTLIKLLAAVTIAYVSFNMFPIMGDSLIWQSVALVRLEDPFMKRSGASRISMIATNDKRRKSFVEAGGVTELTKMLETAPDDKTRREALKALASLCECGVAVEALHATGAERLLRSLADGSVDPDIESQSQLLLKKLENRVKEVV